jgi:hypothetical protein
MAILAKRNTGVLPVLFNVVSIAGRWSVANRARK